MGDRRSILSVIEGYPRNPDSSDYRLTKEQCWTDPQCCYLHGRPAFGPSCTEFVFPGCWHFDSGSIKVRLFVDDVVSEHGGLLHVPPLALHLKSYWEGGGWPTGF